MTENPKPYIVVYTDGPTEHRESVEAYNVSDAMWQVAIRLGARSSAPLPKIIDVFPDKAALTQQREVAAAALAADLSGIARAALRSAKDRS